jgi:hypothetical protein
MTAMADRPILFSAPMVRALLDGRKTQTRRLLNPEPYEYCGEWWIADRVGGDCRLDDWVNDRIGLGPRYVPGDRLWVKEAYRLESSFNNFKPSDLNARAAVQYEADGARSRTWRDDWQAQDLPGKLRPSMFMPRAFSRLTLTVTDVRVQRLQDISEADAVAEGVNPCLCGHNCPNGEHGGCCGICEPVTAYAELWTELHGPGAWAANPWVCALTFTVRRGNIDEASDG